MAVAAVSEESMLMIESNHQIGPAPNPVSLDGQSMGFKISAVS